MKRSSLPSGKYMGFGILHFFYNLVEGDLDWAGRRQFFVGLGLVVFLLMGRAIEQVTHPPFIQQYLDTLPQWASLVVGLALSFVYPQTLRHFMPALVGCVLAVLLASNYVRDLFDLPDLTTGYRYLTASMFGWDYPSINIKSGGYEVAEKSQPGPGQVKKADTNPIPIIGGPGYVSVASGNVALFERVGGPSKVAGAGRHFIRRFETLREVVDLRDQFRTRDEVKALTKDGIPVKVRNVQASFRARTSNRDRTPKETFPFSIAAIKHIAYGKTVGHKGPSVWTDGVLKSVTGIIRGYVSRTRLDDLIARPEADVRDPRDKIKAGFEHKETRKRFADMGVDLLWVSLGHIETPQDVLDERIRTWQADWQRQDKVTLAEGTAEKLRLMEYARALARLDFIETITKHVPLSPDEQPPLELMLVQFAEALGTTRRRSQLSSGGIGELSMKQLRQLTEGGDKGGTVIQG
ncbi:MAG: SPFH domain-containing protein [Chloroflexi bacterium]|nr:SPFH domain-containing protein [Chloroflexota bacterium]